MEHLKEKKQCLEDIQNQEEILKTGSVEPKPGTSRKKKPIYKGAQRPWEGGSSDEAYSSTKGDGGEQQTLGQQSSGTVACVASGFCGSTS